MRNLKNEKGGVLVFTLMTVLILCILGLAMVPLTVMEYKSSNHFANYQKAYFLAEAGIEEAVATLSQGDWDYDGGTGEFSEVGNYSISIDGDDDTKTITATGEIGSISRTIEATVTKQSGNFNISTIATKYGLFSNKNINLDKGATINGDININGNLEIKDNHFYGEGTIYANTIDGIRDVNYDYINKFKLQLGNPENIGEFKIVDYINFLNNSEKYKDKIENINNSSNSSEDNPKIFIGNGNEFEKGSVYYGIVVINNSNLINFHDVEVYGTIITNASGLKFNGDGLKINGSLICTGEDELNNNTGNFKLTINHDDNKIDDYNEVLGYPLDYSLDGSTSTNNSVVVQEWREID